MTTTRPLPYPTDIKADKCMLSKKKRNFLFCRHSKNSTTLKFFPFCLLNYNRLIINMLQTTKPHQHASIQTSKQMNLYHQTTKIDDFVKKRTKNHRLPPHLSTQNYQNVGNRYIYTTNLSARTYQIVDTTLLICRRKLTNLSDKNRVTY